MRADSDRHNADGLFYRTEGLSFVIAGGAISPLLVSSEDQEKYVLFLEVSCSETEISTSH